MHKFMLQLLIMQNGYHKWAYKCLLNCQGHLNQKQMMEQTII